MKPVRETRTGWSGRRDSTRSAVLTEFLARVSMEALQGDTLEAVLQHIVDSVIDHLPVTIASIILLNDAGTHFVQEVWAGEVNLDWPASAPWPVTVGAAGRCAMSGVAQLISNVERDPDYVPGNRTVRSEYLVPIRHGTRLHGVLNLESTSDAFFTTEVCAVFDALAYQVAGAIHLARVVAELEHANRKLQHLSMCDGLTGIANRRRFDLGLTEHWNDCARDGQWLALMLVDVDCFKRLNDCRGHLDGDECLRAIASACAEFVRNEHDVVARYGGEEFALLLPRCELREARQRAERLRRGVQALGLPHPDSTVATHITVSVGVSSLLPAPTGSPQRLVELADRALYAAKAKGRNCVSSRRDTRRAARSTIAPGTARANTPGARRAIRG